MGIVRWKNRKRKLHNAVAPDRKIFYEPLPKKLNLAHRTKFFGYSNTWKLSSYVLFCEWAHLLGKIYMNWRNSSTQTNSCSEQADRLKLTIWQDIQLVTTLILLKESKTFAIQYSVWILSFNSSQNTFTLSNHANITPHLKGDRAWQDNSNIKSSYHIEYVFESAERGLVLPVFSFVEYHQSKKAN